MLRNIMEQEEDRRKEAQRKARAERKAAKELIDQQRNQQAEGEKANGNDCSCKKRRLDDMTYSELANLRPEQAIEVDEIPIVRTQKRPLPLTEQNLSAMNSSARAQCASLNQSEAIKAQKMAQAERRNTDKHNQSPPPRSALKRAGRDRAEQRKQDKPESATPAIAKNRARGWTQPEQMSASEIESRQSSRKFDQGSSEAEQVTQRD